MSQVEMHQCPPVEDSVNATQNIIAPPISDGRPDQGAHYIDGKRDHYLFTS